MFIVEDPMAIIADLEVKLEYLMVEVKNPVVNMEDFIEDITF